MQEVKQRLPLSRRLILLFILVLITASASIEATRGALSIAPFWPANGLALVAILRLRLHDASFKSYAVIALACFVANLACGSPLAAASAFGGANACEVGVAHTLMQWRTSGGRTAFAVMLRRLLPAALLAPALGGLVAVVGLPTTTIAVAGSNWLQWWLAGALGFLIVTPLGLLVSRERFKSLRHKRVWLDILVSLLGVCGALAGVALLHRLATLSLATITVVFAAIRMRALGVVFVVGVLAVLIMPFLGNATFSAISDPIQRIALVQMFLLADGVAGLTVALLLDERDVLMNQLEAKRTQAVEVAERRIRLLASVSHEIRTPLNAIQGCTDLMLTAGPLNARQHNLASAILGAASQLKHLASDLLETAQLEHGPQIRPASVIANDVIANAVRLLRDASSLARAARIRIHAQGNIWADPQRFPQVVTNLVSNAVKYGSAYGPVEIWLRHQRHGVALDVIDRGPGFDPALQGIFEPFAASRPGPESTGLGLSIVKQIVEAHGGSVAMTSAPFVETRVTAIFPYEGVAPPRLRESMEPVDPDSVF